MDTRYEIAIIVIESTSNSFGLDQTKTFRNSLEVTFTVDSTQRFITLFSGGKQVNDKSLIIESSVISHYLITLFPKK